MGGIGREMGKQANEKGFTLVEALVVVAIVAITSAIAAPSVSGWIQNYRAKTVARQLLTDLQFARMTAVSQKQNCTVTVTATTNTYTIQVNGVNQCIPRQLNPETIGNNQTNPYYAPGVALGTAPAANPWTVTFTPLGLASFGPVNVSTATVAQGGVAAYNVQVSPTGGIQVTGGPQVVL